MNRLFDRTALTILLAAVLVCAGAWLRPSHDGGLSEAQFNAQKVLWESSFDIVLLGNSRVERGISPEAMAKVLPNQRIANMGMAGCGLDAEYLQAVYEVLDPDSKRPCIIIGVNPGALCKAAVSDNAFLETQRQQPLELWLIAHGGPVPGWLAPYTRSQLKILVWMGNPGESVVRHSDGWAAFHNVSSAGSKEKLANYNRLFSREQVSAQMTANLLSQIHWWVGRGVRVYGFRPPAGAEMTALEDKLSGFDEDVFAKQFEAAGGRWLRFDATAYNAPDNSHLDAEGAQHFSHDLALALARDY